MYCPVCESQNISKKSETIQLSNIGLDNISLKNVPVITCSDCGFVSRVMPKQKLILKEITESICAIARLINSKEFQFLRNQLGYTGVQLSKILGVTNVSISRWENGEYDINPLADRALRALVLSKFNRNAQLADIMLNTSRNISEKIIVDVERFSNSESFKIKTAYKFGAQTAWLIANNNKCKVA
jgi:putative zinc finger/helix-turn-helix YgiT family protein